MNKIKRYKRGEHKIFDDAYDRYASSSEILNPSAIAHIGSFIWDKDNIQIELIRLLGSDEKGLYKSYDNLTMKGEIPLLQEKLDRLEVQFNEMNLKREMQGKLVLENYPPDMLNEKLQLEARLDICLSEKQLLEQRLKDGAVLKEQTRKSTMLQYGLRCQMSRNEIDGQRTGMLDNKLIIVDSASPYHGMAVTDYRQLSEKWLQMRRQANNEKLLKIQNEAMAKGLPVPSMLKASSLKTIDKRSLPQFPKEYKNYLEVEIPIKRTK